jgi:hypothetical protein
VCCVWFGWLEEGFWAGESCWLLWGIGMMVMDFGGLRG